MATRRAPNGIKEGETIVTKEGVTTGSTKGVKNGMSHRTKEDISKFLENKKKSWKSIKNQFV